MRVMQVEVPAKEDQGNIQHISRGQEAETIIHIIRLKDHILLHAVLLRLQDLTRLLADHPHREAVTAAEEAAAVRRAEEDNGDEKYENN
jgi:hypothetical protein